jgi:hypothetical protein
MSLTADEPRPHEAPDSEPCAICGEPLAADQEWCLECGSARTLIHRPPDWRIAVVAAVTVVLAILIAFAIAAINLSSDSNRQLAAVSTSTTASTSSSGTTSATTTRTAAARIASWPVGLSGWTALLSRQPTRAAAVREARRLAARGVRVGVLSTSVHPFLRPGYWIVFSGRYAGPIGASAAAQRLTARGLPAEAREIAPPGGL